MSKIKKEVFRGLSALLAFLLIVVTFGSGIANSYAGRINTVLGVSTSKVIPGEASNVDTNYYKSDYGTDIYDVAALERLEADAAQEAIGETEDGVVLLKNDNNALPLAEGSSVSLFGNNTVNPNYSYHSTGNSMQELATYVGSMQAVHDVNQELVSAYQSSGVSRVKSVTDPVIGEAPVNLYTDALKQSWKGDAAIVLLTREASEDCDVVLKTSEGISQLAMSRNELDMMAMLKAEKEAGNRNLELLAQQASLEAQQKLLLLSQKSYEEMKLLRHEIKNHDAYIEMLLANRQYEELEQYVRKRQSVSHDPMEQIRCGNQVIDAAVNQGMAMAKLEGVRLEVKAAVPARLSIQDPDLFALLNNLLSNAIESSAAAKAAGSAVQIRIYQERGYLFIHMENPIDPSVEAVERLKLRTTKENRELHGYGTKVIQRIAEQYNGYVQYDIQGHRFISDLMLAAAEV